MGRIIAFDIGDKRIGVAITDPFNEMALPVETYWRKSLSKDSLRASRKFRRKGMRTDGKDEVFH